MRETEQWQPSMTTEDRRDTTTMSTRAAVTEAQEWDRLLGYLLDLAG